MPPRREHFHAAVEAVLVRIAGFLKSYSKVSSSSRSSFSPARRCFQAARDNRGNRACRVWKITPAIDWRFEASDQLVDAGALSGRQRRQ
jgi:hypothetical protein